MINVADILRAVPSFGVSALSSANSNFLTASSGINTLQLRNLEEDRTLVLVNGRRYVSGVAGSAAVDFNTIPTELIERVEIITGGASAIYGSDALAGVINVILRDDFEGVNFGYQYGEADAGGEIENRFNFTAGGNFADGRGNAVVSRRPIPSRRACCPASAPTRGSTTSPLCVHRLPRRLPDSQSSRYVLELLRVRPFFVPSTGESFTVSEGTGAERHGRSLGLRPVRLQPAGIPALHGADRSLPDLHACSTTTWAGGVNCVRGGDVRADPH